MKKTTAWLLAASVLLTTTTMVHAELNQTGQPEQAVMTNMTTITNNVPVSYKDLGNHYSKKSVERLAKMGVLQNKSDSYSPVAKMDRAEAKALLEKVLGRTLQDKNPSDSYVRRSEVAEWLASTLPPMNTGVAGMNVDYPFIDTPSATKEQRNAYFLLYSLGLMVGDGQGHFNPDQGLMKGDAAILADNVLHRSMQASTPATFDKVSDQLPESVYTMIQENKMQPGLYSVVDGDTRYVMVAGGEVPTTGYSVDLVTVSQTNAGIFVTANLMKPEPGELQGQVVSYPYQIIKLQDTTKSVYLLDQNN